MTSSEIRQQFLDFFAGKGHTIVPSAPIVVKNDPTLMFTNAGMNQFKDYFLGNEIPLSNRVADTQKCLRVSGKHNDLEEVGVDTYHHTMFEMLGNWSFGNPADPSAGYFKKEAIAWSWELLTRVYRLPADRLYVTIFEGDEKEGIPRDEEAFEEWKKVISEDRILLGSKKDNFWEMGETGPCGPCTEIHFDSRNDAERLDIDGKILVNADHPLVIEIWNNVFIQFNRKKDGSLEPLPAKHVDTGMGFERLVRVIQGKYSNYDTDVFVPTIKATEKLTGVGYNPKLVTPSPAGEEKVNIAFRVIADHIRAISFAIADGQLPSNTGAGYVIRRILRRAVRYYFSFLNYKQPLLFQLVPLIANQFEFVFPELKKQEAFVTKVILEEENGFLRTLDNGLKRIEEIIKKAESGKGSEIIQGPHPTHIPPGEGNLSATRRIGGEESFELYDTYGFPFDLTHLIASENNMEVDEEGFKVAMQKQKDRSRKAAVVDTEDWVILDEQSNVQFTGYHHTESTTGILKYRKVTAKGKTQYQLVLKQTPFYAESGGQVGDTGELWFGDQKIDVLDTKKENDLIIHIVNEIPGDLAGEVTARIDTSRRRKIARHHSVTHLMHSALRQVLGKHVAQKGSMVNEDNLRFDFSHFAKMTDEEIAEVEKIVNRKIRQNIPVIIKEMAKDEAMKLGAMALFGEKYGDRVRVVIMDEKFSIELCGGTHVMNTGELNIFKIISEGAVAAGVRRIEALAGCKAEAYINQQLRVLNQIRTRFKNPKDIVKAIEQMHEEQLKMEKRMERIESGLLAGLKTELMEKVQVINGIHFVGKQVNVTSADALRKICMEIKNELKNSVVVLTAIVDEKAAVAIGIDEQLANSKQLDAQKWIRDIAVPLIKGGGGGQKSLATAGGQQTTHLEEIITQVKNLFI